LTKLEYVHIQDGKIAKVLKSIELACPNLKDVTLGENKREDALKPSWYNQSYLGQNLEYPAPPSKGAFKVDTAPKHLELTLSKCPKV